MATEDKGSWDSIDETRSFQEQIGRSHDTGTMDGDSGMDEADTPLPLSMPDEALDLEDGSTDDMDERGFREQLPTQLTEDAQMIDPEMEYGKQKGAGDDKAGEDGDAEDEKAAY